MLRDSFVDEHKTPTLSSGESELYASNQGGMEALGFAFISEDMVDGIVVRIKIDAIS